MSLITASELRAKYSQADRDKMANGGQAMPDGSYPIADVEDLKNAIRAVGRGSGSHDAIRKHIVKRARALGHSDLIPDNWNSDGSLAEAAGAWSDEEQRETYNDRVVAVSQALTDELENDWCWWIQDLDDEFVYYQNGAAIYARPYAVEDGGPVALGDPQRVRPVTSYVPVDPEDEVERSANGNGHVTVPLTNTIAARKARVPKRGDLEQRTLPLEELELRRTELKAQDSDEALLEFNGYASIFDRAYRVGSYEEKIERGAFKRSLANPNLDCVLRTEHDGLPLARTTGSIKLSDGAEVPTLILDEDDTGLHVRALLDPTDPDVQRLVPKYRRGDLKEMSFAFRCNADVWSEDYTERTIRLAEIHRGDVSIVTYGASPTTTSAMRSEDAVVELRAIGAEGMVGSLQDFAFSWVSSYLAKHGERKTLQELEGRAGKVLSSTSMDTLVHILGLISDADDAVDEAQPLLADLMGVPNPDADDDADDDEGDGTERAAEPPEEQEAPVEQLATNDTDELRLEYEVRALRSGR